ncbi:MAG: glycolate oxidase subunit GlcE [Thiomonas sp. 14-64-326]|jgi:glycolate oxidase FAD binding subunit|uniref:FAD linked oxidase domain protein n=1 Tax=Thiomonas intermedia (strain K12) TaxID=75379 RepID=D5X5V2_THIK1|nr:glycolate oxidase subunit GlcE [Thiomonas sp.]OZB73257.1 MAG: glycolate oxidase subunit GlcE [Thiomonas sp. 14-64-326]
MQADDLIPLWQDLVREAASRGERIRIHGGGSKAPWWAAAQHSGVDAAEHTLDATQLSGITHFEPTELVITARAGTPLAEIEAALAEHHQFLPFEPPHFARIGRATLGGMVASALSGPARISAGGVRDYVLGATLLSGKGEVLRFGGEVMKNVAGFDVSRLLCGSLGSLGVILDVSLKIMPVAPAQTTLRFSMTQDEAITRCNTWAAQPLPLNASAWLPDRSAGTGKGVLTLRLRGAQAAVQAAQTRLGGERMAEAEAAAFWTGLREQTLPWFAPTWPGDSQAALWRLSLPSTAPALDLSGTQLVEWFGGLRWLISAAPASIIHEAARQTGGHATRFRGGDASAPVFDTAQATLLRIQRNVKAAFDPHGVFPTLF